MSSPLTIFIHNSVFLCSTDLLGCRIFLSLSEYLENYVVLFSFSKKKIFSRQYLSTYLRTLCVDQADFELKKIRPASALLSAGIKGVTDTLSFLLVFVSGFFETRSHYVVVALNSLSSLLT